MKKYLLSILSMLHILSTIAQVTCSANNDSGSGYAAFTNAGLGIENPDCKHTDFGAHVTQVFDAELNRNVFVFHSHIVEDNDRCQVFDRVRMEVKGGPNTDEELQHTQNSTSFYRWKFRLDENFIGAATFNHLFQNKPKGGDDESFPILTITARTNVIELRHNGGDTGNDLGVLASANLNLFRGKWVEVYFRQVHGENGELEVSIRDIATGLSILEYTNLDIDLWRLGAAYNRPKWGMYRLKNTVLQDESIRFADFCISEVNSVLCPADAVLIPDTEAPTAPTNLIATSVSINSVNLSWGAATDLYGVELYEILQDSEVIQTAADTLASINNLAPSTSYTFAIRAKDAAGNVSLESNTITITTDAATALPQAANNPMPEDGAVNLGINTLLSWDTGSNTDSFQIYLGLTENPELLTIQTNTTIQVQLIASATYFWKVVATNTNGQTSSPLWSFTTGGSNPDFPWLVYRANERPELETNFLVLNETPENPVTSEITQDPNGSTNTFYGFRSADSEKFRWRHDFLPSDSVITLVVRLRAIDPSVTGICHFEVRGNGWRQKVRINQSSIKLEKTTPEIEVDLPFDWTAEMHLFRMVSDGKNTHIYLDENPIPFVSGISDTPSTNHYFEWGNSGGIDYGAYIDWMAIDKTGVYDPSAGSNLPTDLFLSSIATLSSITVDGVPLDNFSPNVLEYTVEVVGTDVPNLTWTSTSDLAIVNSSNPSTVPNTQATITVTAQDGFSQQLYKLNYIGSTSTNNQSIKDQIQLFPNPTNDTLKVIFENNKNARASIFSLDGKTMLDDILLDQETTITIRDFPSGTYVLFIYANNQSTSFMLSKD